MAVRNRDQADPELILQGAARLSDPQPDIDPVPVAVAGATLGALTGGILEGVAGGSASRITRGAIIGGVAGAGVALAARVRETYRVSRRTFARLANVSERTLANWEKADPMTEGQLRPIRELDRLHGALARVVKPEAIPAWLERPNPAFDGSTPIQVIERGEADRIWRMIYYLESGAAF